VSRKVLSPVLGKWTFWLMFIGMHVTFLPMHITGLAGMPRRIWTYSEASGWGPLNMLSTGGAYLIAAGVAVFLVDLLRNFRPGQGDVENPWRAGTLEWLPSQVYSMRSIPQVTSREPLWDNPELVEQVRGGHHFLPNAPTGGRETLITSPVDAVPQYVIQMPGPGWSHVAAAVFTAACFLLLTVKVVVPALACAVIAIASCLHWTWELDKGPDAGPVDIGGGYRLPVYVTGPDGHGWWAMVVLMLVAGSLYLAWIFAYLYLWTVSPEVWPEQAALPAWRWPGLSALLLIASVPISILARRSLAPPGQRNHLTPFWIALSAVLLVAALVVEGISQWQAGVNPAQSSHDAMVFMAVILSGQLTFAVVIMSGYVIARHYTGKLDRIRCATLENTQLLGYYTVAQALLGLLLIHGFPLLT
jgi:cytochrome c oxidase subunit I+III